MMQLETDGEHIVRPDIQSPVHPRSESLATLHFHPDFSSPEANVVLAAKESKMYFRVHLFTLKSTSGFFRTMYSLPQSSMSDSDTMYLEEDAEVLTILLQMICGLSFADITSFDLLESVLSAAEKYDMPGAMSILRMCLLSPALSDNPIRLYALAKRHGWDAVAKTLSTRTLSLNIYDPIHYPSLRNMPPDALLDLFVLHRSRRDGMKDCLDGPPFVSGEPADCIQCHSPINYNTWRELKYRILAEMDHRPLGDTILDPGISTWPESIACWTAACAECHRLLYDKTETIRVIRECIDKLESTT